MADSSYTMSSCLSHTYARACLYLLPLHVANVILMIADGFGPTSQTFARNLYQYEKQLSVDDTDWVLPLDPLLVGTSRTAPSHLNVNHSSSRPQKIIPITDSAAGATAFSCGIKTYNGAIGGKNMLMWLT